MPSPSPRLLSALLPALAFAALTDSPAKAENPQEWSGIYPHLAYFNEEGECGSGAVVPWADRLWVITYGPHLPLGSTDKLYEITPDLELIVRPESVGGTPANRMIHEESQQLIIGPYFIGKDRTVRVVPPVQMPGRLTGNARHLTDPSNKVYFATMEEGLYEVDVHNLEVTGLIRDGNRPKKDQPQMPRPANISSELPGYHGKGLYSGQGRVVYSNNGENSPEAKANPHTPSGALGEWFGSGDWQLVRRNQFTEVTGPGGLSGNKNPESDPIWSTGWDAKSALLMVLDKGKWHLFRLPKASHCYDGAHGWNTEWPRIREIGEPNLLMTMHGSFWDFPPTFSAGNTTGIRPRSTYLKVIGDFCRWGDRLVFGCDDTARSAFLNERQGNDILLGPGQSQSNLWFTTSETLNHLGPALGRGAVWLSEDVAAGAVSDPFLCAGFTRRGLHLAHSTPATARITLEIDAKGNGAWEVWKTVELSPDSSKWEDLSSLKAEWIRLRAETKADRMLAQFSYSNDDRRSAETDSVFDGLADLGDSDGNATLFRATGDNQRSLLIAAAPLQADAPSTPAYYSMDISMRLNPLDHPKPESTRLSTKLPGGKLEADAASLRFVDPKGKAWRLPKGDSRYDALLNHPYVRILREVSTEREVFHAHGTFYELPVDNAGGFAKIRPVSSHGKHITDFASYRGLLVLGGTSGATENRHILRSSDGKAAVWVGAFDDLWKLGKPRGIGGPWLDSEVLANKPSEPYLMTGYDRKSLELSHQSDKTINLRVEVDVSGDGHWVAYQTFAVPAGKNLRHEFPAAFSAYWLRVVSDADTKATARLTYE